MGIRITAIFLALSVALAGSVAHVGHLCDVEGPVMGPDCCCGDAEKDQQDEAAAELDSPACCDGSTEVTTTHGLNVSAECPKPASAALGIAEPLEMPQQHRFAAQVQYVLGPRAPPDPPRAALHLRNCVFLI